MDSLRQLKENKIANLQSKWSSLRQRSQILNHNSLKKLNFHLPCKNMYLILISSYELNTALQQNLRFLLSGYPFQNKEIEGK